MDTLVFDNFDPETASKDELLQFALLYYHKELTGRDSKDTIKRKVKALMGGESDEEVPTKTTPKPYEYCLNEDNGRVLDASTGMKRLVELGRLVPCDKHGNRL